MTEIFVRDPRALSETTLIRMWIATIIIALVFGHSMAADHVVLLHGLCRTNKSMSLMKKALENAGFRVSNIDYPSRTASVTVLSETIVGQAIDDCRRDGATRINFVTHSLGGILVRSYLSRHSVPELGHVVMLGPPNQGSEIVDKLGNFWLFKILNGPAGEELGTGSDAIPNKLGPVTFTLGVIAGNSSINWINSLLIPGSDDGKVSIERTKVAGMADHIVLPSSHPYLMKNREAIRQTIWFLRNGAFDRSIARN